MKHYTSLKTLPAPLLLGAVLLLCFGYHLGVPPLFDLDEGAFSAASWEMLQRHDFITTYLNGELRFDKPILIYWLQAASISVFGLHEWALRLPSALAASIWVVAIYAFARIRLEETGGLVAALLAAFSVGVMVIGRAATADALLNVFIALCMLDAYRYFEQSSSMARYRVYLWMGLGVLTKGPIAVLIPLAVCLIYAAVDKRWLQLRRALLSPIGWLIMLAVALPWYLLEYQAQGQAFIDGFFLKHNIGRFSNTMEGHGGNLFYYLPVALLICLPFTGLLLRILPRIRQALKDPLDLWLWLWFGFIFLFFSFSSTQLPHYLLYGATPLFLLMAKYRDDLQSKALAYTPLLLWLILLILLPDILPKVLNGAGDLYSQALAQHAAEVFGVGYRVGTWAALALTVGLMLLRNKPLWYGLLAAGAVHAFIIIQWLAPAAGALMQQPVKNAAQLARSYPGEVVMWDVNMPSFIVYREKITPRREPRSGDLVFTRINDLSKLGPHEVVYSKGGIVLAKKQ
jgi:hypothetical protein